MYESDDKCNVNPCSTGKSCVTVYTCACPAGYEGDECKKGTNIYSTAGKMTNSINFKPYNFFLCF